MSGLRVRINGFTVVQDDGTSVRYEVDDEGKAAPVEPDDDTSED